MFCIKYQYTGNCIYYESLTVEYCTLSNVLRINLLLLLKVKKKHRKEHKTIFGGDGYVKYLACSDGNMIECICPNPSICVH